jgi:hypothetical protein
MLHDRKPLQDIYRPTGRNSPRVSGDLFPHGVTPTSQGCEVGFTPLRAPPGCPVGEPAR